VGNALFELILQCVSRYSATRLVCFFSDFSKIDILVQKIDSLVLKMHKTLVLDWLAYVENILQPSFVGPFDVVGLRHLSTMPMP